MRYGSPLWETEYGNVISTAGVIATEEKYGTEKIQRRQLSQFIIRQTK